MSIRSCLSRVVLVLLLVVPFLTGPLGAADIWVPIGPDGGTVTALAWAPDGRTVHAGTFQGGVFRSLDGGRTWTAGGKGLRGTVNDIAIDPRQPSAVYAATTEGLFRSLDGGATWRDVAPREAAVYGVISALAVVTSVHGTVYASFDGFTQGGLFRSTDRGTTWRPVGQEVPGPAFTLAGDPRHRRVVAGTSRGVFQSWDGVTWSLAGFHLQRVDDVLIDPHQPGRLLALILEGGWQDLRRPVVYVSENGGRWRRSPLTAEGMAYGPGSLVAAPTAPGTFYAYVATALDESADLYRSTDGGRRWKAVHQGRGLTALAVHPKRPRVLLASRNLLDPDTAVLRSEDHGATWSPSGTGLQAPFLNDFAAASGTLYSLLPYCPLRRSEAGGGAWQEMDYSPWGETLALDPADPGAVYMSSQSGLWRSPDRGQSWSSIFRDAGNEGVLGVAADPAAPGSLYIIVAGRLIRTRDGGATWETTLAEGYFARLVTLGPGVMPGPPSSVWIQADPVQQGVVEPGSNRVLRSTDGGLTWTTLLTLGALDEQVTAIAPDPGDPRRAVVAFTRFVALYRAVAGGIYRTADGGVTWEPSRLPNRRPVFSLAFDPLDPARVYAGSLGGVFVSADGGATWTALGDGLPASRVIRLVFDPDDPGLLYAATQGGGVWRLTRLE